MLGAAHAGWRGLLEGVIAATVATMRSLGAADIRATIGPCIRAECYEFGVPDLDRLVDRFDHTVGGTTRDGRPALDVPAAVRAALSEAGVDAIEDVDVCTACSGEHFSHRARGDKERQALVLWM